MRNELILLVTYKKNTESSPTSKILRLNRSTIPPITLENFHNFLSYTQLFRDLLDEPYATVLHISILNQLEEFLLKL